MKTNMLQQKLWLISATCLSRGRMKGFYWGMGSVKCGFCGNHHHNVTTCKMVNKVASRAFHNMANIPGHVVTRQENKAIYEMKRREERKISNPATKGRRRKSRCSYCKSTEHKRPKCDSLRDFRQTVYKANKNWKRLLVHRVNECGLGLGALIRMDGDLVKNLSFNLEPNGIAMITKYNLKDLSVFCALDTYSHYQGNSTFGIMSGEWTENVSVKFLSTILGEGLLARGWWYNNPDPKLLAGMPWKPSEEWVNSEWDEVMDWFFKDVKQEDIIGSGLAAFIQKWADKV